MKKLILFCLVSLLIFLLSNPVAYSGLTEEQKKLQRYKEQLKYVQQQIANVNYNESSVIALLGNLEAEAQGVRQNISVIQNKISVLEKEISEKKQIIAENEKLIEENKKAICTALNLSYKMSEISPVELLFSGQDINSSADKVAYISYIAGAN